MKNLDLEKEGYQRPLATITTFRVNNILEQSSFRVDYELEEGAEDTFTEI